ncbi:MAG: dienelactone hydrolase family protein [Stenomitos frigidus ULC029]
MTIQTTAVQIANNGLQIDAYLAQPIGSDTYPGIVVIQEIWGVNSHIRSVTERLAQEGYVAIAPAIFQRSAPGFEGNYDADSTVLGRQYKEATKADELLSDVQATIAYLQALPTVQGDAIGAIGFCFGGHVVYLAAALPAIKATASFYGGGIATMTPGGGQPTLTRTPEIKGTLYAFFGTTDPLIPVEQIDAIEDALKAHQSDHRFFRYPSGHGFFCDQRPDYNPEDAADAWEKVKELFGRVLK